ncbi:MAG: gamma-glutamyltransferase [Pseudomonadota bacterium]
MTLSRPAASASRPRRRSQRRAPLYAAGALIAATLVAATPPAAAQDQAANARATPEAASGRTPKPLLTAARDAVVAAHPLATAAGDAILAEGGSAADAAIATLLALNVVEPQSSGLGGGAFALVHDPEDGLTSYDGRETAPTAAGPDLFLVDGAPLSFWTAVASGRSVGTPGLAALMARLHERHGRLPWARLVEPALALARDGFAVSPRLAASVAATAERLAGTDAAALFLPDGQPLAVGETFRQPALAVTLATLQAEGPTAFYRGTIAQAVVAGTRTGDLPGTLSLDDLAGYRVVERAPVCLTYRAAWRVCGMGPPSSGATTVGQILGLMDGGAAPAPGSAAAAHLFAEASRLAYADRALYLGDPDHVDVPTAGLLDRGYLAARRRLIDPARAAEGAAAPGTPPEREGRRRAPDATLTDNGTTHLSVVDADGMAIALTASIEQAFGSGRMAAGFLLNNELTDFAFAPTGPGGAPKANAPGPGKRPRSSMAPTIVYALGGPDRPRLVLGSPGGSRIPEYVAGALIAMLDDGADAAQAAARGHVSHRNRDRLVLEAEAHPAALAEALAGYGHTVETAAMTSGLHIIAIGADDALSAGADPRREGSALGR